MEKDLNCGKMSFMKISMAYPMMMTLLVAFMIAPMLVSVNVFAARNTASEAVSTISETYVNPLYADILSEEDLNQPQNDGIMTAEVEEYYDDMEEAVTELRSGMKNREETVEIGYMTTDITNADDDEIASSQVSSICTSIITEAVAHTGVANEGDYLLWQYGGYHIGGSSRRTSTACYMDITYTMTYYTTAEQEATVTEKIDEVLDSLQLDSAGDYQKIKAIYDYICTNVTYDNTEHEDDMLQYTAYGALIDGTAVCQGYAVLYYRMLLECDIDARFISGIGKSDKHGWNIVKLGNYYYNADTTWDASYYKSNGTYRYFLCCEDSFINHTRDEKYDTEEFNVAYPMSNTDYDAENHTHYYDSPIFNWAEDYSTCTVTFTCVERDDTQTVNCTVDVATTEVTCTTDGQIIYTATCSFEGRTYTDEQIMITEVATGHTEEIRNAKATTCTEEGYSGDTFCSVCGELLSTGETIAATGHTEEIRNAKEATCTEAGYSGDTYCSVCGEQLSTGETIVASHTEEIRNAKAATCTEEGYSGDTYCSVCGELLSTGEIIAATGHTWNSGKITTPATATTAGVKTFTCTKCGATKTETVPATGAPAVGTTLTYGKNQYQVTKAGISGGTVSLKKAASTVTSFTVPATITVEGITYKVMAIADSAFSNCKKLKSVTISNNVISIGNSAFSGCKKLQAVTIGKNVTSIGNNAFANCTKLSKITIPAKVTKIGKKAFYNCKKLKTITIKSKKLNAVGKKAITGIHKKAVIKVPASKKKAYKKLFLTKTGFKKTMKIK